MDLLGHNYTHFKFCQKQPDCYPKGLDQFMLAPEMCTFPFPSIITSEFSTTVSHCFNLYLFFKNISKWSLKKSLSSFPNIFLQVIFPLACLFFFKSLCRFLYIIWTEFFDIRVANNSTHFLLTLFTFFYCIYFNFIIRL